MSDLVVEDLDGIIKQILQVLDEHEMRLKLVEERLQTSISTIECEDTASIVMLRVIEHGGRIYQKELQKMLGVRSRTTMAKLVHKLVRTGKISVRRVGRRNLIEVGCR